MSDICTICIKTGCDSYTICNHVYCVSCLDKLIDCVVCGQRLKSLYKKTIYVDITNKTKQSKFKFEEEKDECIVM
jgi:hypothetical protein